MNDKFRETFREEAEELLSQLEDIFLELESNPTDKEVINAAFRAIHTIKGSAGMFGYEKAGKFTHDLEGLLDACRSGKHAVDKKVIDLSLRARDKIRELLAEENNSEPFDEEALGLMAEFKAAIEGKKPNEKKAEEDKKPKEAEEDKKVVEEEKHTKASPKVNTEKQSTHDSKNEPMNIYRINFIPEKDIFKNGTKLENIFNELSEIGTMSVVADLSKVPILDNLKPEDCYSSWIIFLSTNKGIDAIKDVFIFVELSSKINIEILEQPDENSNKKLGEILIERGLVNADDLSEALQSQRRLGEVLVERNVVSASDLDSALVEQAHFKKTQDKFTEHSATIRVGSDKLDQLVDLVGELVTMQARLSKTAIDYKDSVIESIAEQFDRLVSQLRDNAMSMRMLAIGSTFNKFRRVVRDLSNDLGKEVELVTIGAETELDKTVIERLNDPLVHIIRNSLDHGIEKPEDRINLGKPEKGTVTLCAEHSGANVIISVSDDGRGLDLEAVKRKAIENGLIDANAQISEQDAYMMIFKPGFSTASKITSVSGRGVGMDVVKKEIDSLGGSVSVSSTPNKGMSIILRIPLTLAIIEGLLVRIGNERFILPLSVVESCIEAEDVEIKNGTSVIHYREDLLPSIDLRSFFKVPGDVPENKQIVVVSIQDMKCGVLVDEVIGDFQTVIKPLGRMYRDAVGISGATILGDGEVALIIDCARIASSISLHENEWKEKAC